MTSPSERVSAFPIPGSIPPHQVGFGGQDFELSHQVGSGAFGVVYRAINRREGSSVAVKVLHSSNAVSDKRFDREAALLAELSHPSIVRYIAHGRTQQGHRYLVMEWLEGQTLETRLQRGALAVEEVLVLARRVVGGLAVAARLGVVHRDLKPANVYLSS